MKENMLYYTDKDLSSRIKQHVGSEENTKTRG